MATVLRWEFQMLFSFLWPFHALGFFDSHGPTAIWYYILYTKSILVPRGRTPFGQHQESRPLAVSNNGSTRFTDFPSLCTCSESSLTNLIGSGLNLLCLQIHSKPECRWTWSEVAILGADQKERSLWGQECTKSRKCTSYVWHYITSEVYFYILK